jgi:putative zinc finger/helix-turn-helix YgiT family protein
MTDMTKTQNFKTCAICGSVAATSTMTYHEFDYRLGSKLVTLSARIPVMECDDCDEAYFGDGAEEIKHEAVCDFLGRLTPRAIVGLRESLGMSQAQLAAHTGIGVASIKRWETGLVVQGAALDRQLRNLEPIVDQGSASPWAGSFRTPITEAIRRKAKTFSLRPTHSQTLEAAACM